MVGVHYEIVGQTDINMIGQTTILNDFVVFNIIRNQIITMKIPTLHTQSCASSTASWKSK